MDNEARKECINLDEHKVDAPTVPKSAATPHPKGRPRKASNAALPAPGLAVPKLGEWWLTRTGCIAHCFCCKKQIDKYAPRLIYCPVPKPEYSCNPASYSYMHSKIVRHAFHVDAVCLPRPYSGLAGLQIEEVVGKHNLFVEIKHLPKTMAESSSDYMASVAKFTRDALRELRSVGHQATVDVCSLSVG
jgi:hypothetical protein